MNRPTRYLATAALIALAFGACITSASAATHPSRTLSMNPADPESHDFELGINNVPQEYLRAINGVEPTSAVVIRGSSRSQYVNDLIGCTVIANTVNLAEQAATLVYNSVTVR
jgi:hypothetical protein